MNQQERDALREKHQQVWLAGGIEVCNYCDTPAGLAFYPCDVIKVLDAWEAEPMSLEVAQRVYQEWIESQWETDVPVGFQGAL
jgi:hypothetical protein